MGENSFVTYETICKETGIKNRKTIGDNVKILKEYGLLDYEKITHGHGSGRSHHDYKIPDPKDNERYKDFFTDEGINNESNN